MQLEKEEILEVKPEGIVFSKCPDGDVVLLHPDGTVGRFSHEIPEEIEHWPSLAQFFMDETAL